MAVRFASCCPTKKHYGKGKCKSCYYRAIRKEDPERARRLDKKRYQNNPSTKRAILAWRERNPEKVKAAKAKWHKENREFRLQQHHRNYLATRYGLTETAYRKLIQESCCGICGTRPPEVRRLILDHDHTTNQIRGILCDECNRGLSAFKDSPKILDAARVYLANTVRLFERVCRDAHKIGL